jgi:hypothetical protein
MKEALAQPSNPVITDASSIPSARTSTSWKSCDFHHHVEFLPTLRYTIGYNCCCIPAPSQLHCRTFAATLHQQIPVFSLDKLLRSAKGAHPMSMRTSFLKPSVSRLPDVVGLGGALAGLSGGIAMVIVAILVSAAKGDDVFLEVKQIAGVVYGTSAIAEPGFVAGPVLVGLVIHLIVSMAFGAIFGIVMRRLLHLTSDFGTLVLAGMIYGMFIWMAGYFVVLPIINPLLLQSYAPAFIIEHLVYGLVTGLVYTWLRPAPYS